jgi:hypothetical protein
VLAAGVLAGRPTRGPAGADDVLLLDALAEAWHVDGRFAASARAWTEAFAQVPSWQRALNTAAALVSMSGTTPWERWMDRARSLGAPAGTWSYYLGLARWRAGDPAGAEAALTVAARDGSEPAGNALAALLRQQDRGDEATAIWRRSYLAGTGHALTLVNIARSVDGVPAETVLRDAVEAAVHEAAPFAELACRRQRQAPDPARDTARDTAADAAALARRKAALRTGWLGTVPQTVPAADGPAANRAVATVTGRLGRDGCELTVELPGGGRQIVVNAGYRVWLDGVPAAPVPDAAGSTPTAVAPTAVYDLATASGRVAVRLAGRPSGGGTRWGDDRVELDSRSFWLPVVLPPRPHRWNVTLAHDPRLVLALSDDRPAATGPGLLLARPDAWAPAPAPAPAGGPGPPGVRTLHRWYDAGREVWSAVLGPAPRPPLVVVAARGSVFCYARARYVRVASGILHRPSQWSQLAHEAAHAWWGGQVRFAEPDEWFAEALAEFTLHELDDRGVCAGYRRDTMAAAAGEHLAATAAAGLAELAATGGRIAAYLVRAKGGFLIAHLKAVLGADTFHRWLRTLAALGRTRRLRVYDAFAVASWLHGASLGWLANQWLFERVEPWVDVVAHRCRTGSGWRCTVRVTSRSVLCLGVPVELAVTGPDGDGRRLAARLDAGSDELATPTAARPEAVDLDPDRRFWLWPRQSWEDDR